MDNNKKNIYADIEDFKDLIDKNGYFVDKTLMIKKLLESNAKVILFTRPRRFGKTLNQSMIKRFLENESTEQGLHVDNGYLFDGLNISLCSEKILQHQQQYPVIFISLKSAKQPDFDEAYRKICEEIAGEFLRHQYILKSERFDEAQKTEYHRIMTERADFTEYCTSLRFLSECLANYHNCNTFVLVDAYDVPLESAYAYGFYKEMTSLMYSLLGSVFKGNQHLEKGIITGNMSLKGESDIGGFNNFVTDNVLHTGYGESFGFTQEEVEAMLKYYDLGSYIPEVKKWYDGYLFGDAEIYNPWSILKYVTDHERKVTEFPLPYWSNTSSNSIVREMISDADEKTRADLEILMDGGSIEKPVHEDITYGDIHTSMDNLWNFLFFTGYLKAGRQRIEERNIYLEMSIPNEEIASIYQNSITLWFDKKIEKTDRSPLVKALESGDCEAAEEFISAQLMDTISYFDYAENYYHGFMTGLLTGAGSYRVTSNRESGTGRPDIVMTEKKFMGRAIILELKISDTFKGMESKCEEALEQIEKQKYAVPLEDDGYQEILKYAVCFFKKGCIIRKAE